MNHLTILALSVLVITTFTTISSSESAVIPDPVCAKHEVYSACGTACPEHCPVLNPSTGTLETRAHYCNKNCIRGCFCSGTLVRDLKRSNLCVEKSACSPP